MPDGIGDVPEASEVPDRPSVAREVGGDCGIVPIRDAGLHRDVPEAGEVPDRPSVAREVVDLTGIEPVTS
jgi:hypothetical protein